MADTTKICRICLQQIMKNTPYHFLDDKSDLMLKSKLLDFLPELDLNITQNPITCSQCTRTITEVHQFKQMCLQTENNIKNQTLQILPFFKKEPLDETIKEEFVEDPIKNELFSLQTIKDECVQINTDIPVCIEESTTTRASYYCHNCNFCTDKKENLISHVLTHQNNDRLYNKHLEKPFYCNICSYHCRYNSSLIRHLRTHSGEKPFYCNTCSYRCNSNWSLKIHLRIHTSEKPFCCNVCDYRCNDKSTLKRHLHTHTGEKRFCCSICHYGSHQMSKLTRHLRTHTGEKPFCCNICDYRCNQMSTLKSHLRTHTGEKPFFCNICNYRCNQKSSLNRHLLTHTRKKVLLKQMRLPQC